ncbi:MAG: DUF6580 family putative transport protein [Chitinophagales bacterium]|nr:hypothetical protein [Chitinophagales bacterium]MDW8394061.1 DUF6580 family putative transport protein [Chitinophagales bacterium]
MKRWLTSPYAPVIFLMVLAAVLRLLSNELKLWDVTPVTALALFGGSMISDRRLALLMPMTVLLITDAFIGFYDGMWLVYLSFALVVFLGKWIISRPTPVRIVAASLTASTLFYLITNLALFYPQTMYPHTWDGIVQSYVAAWPFYRNALFGDLMYCGIFFGGYVLLQRLAVLFQPKS